MPIPSEELDAHFLPSAGRKRETSNSIFCESAKRRPKASTALTPWYGCRVEKRIALPLYSPCTKYQAFMRSNASVRMQREEIHESKRANLRILLTMNSFFNIVYARIRIRELYFLPLDIMCIQLSDTLIAYIFDSQSR